MPPAWRRVALACLASIPAACLGFVLPFLGWGLLTGEGEDADPLEMLAFGIVAAVVLLPVMLLLVPLLALAAHLLLRRAGQRGPAAYGGAGAVLGALAGLGVAALGEALSLVGNTIIGALPGLGAGLGASLAFWAVIRPDAARTLMDGPAPRQ